MTISSFQGEYRFLSNFYPCTITWSIFTYPSVEHAYQSAKTTDPVERACIAMAPRPGQAKAYGRKVKHPREDWDEMKIGIMKQLLRKKFQDTELRTKLLSTSPHVLVEGNYWHDTFWGVCNGTGQNWLGRLLMEVREEIR